MSEYKQCPNGHYYQGDYCPCCLNRKAFEYGHNVFNSTPGLDGIPVIHVKVCPNGHGYDSSLQSCPFCGSEVVSSEVNQRAGFTVGITNLPLKKDGDTVRCDFANVDGNYLSGELYMRIEHTFLFKYAYYIAKESTDGSAALLIKPESLVRLSGDGFSQTLTGRDFYKKCDTEFDKQEIL